VIRRLVPLLLVLTCVLAGCGEGDSSSYTPKESTVLFAEIAAIDGVTSVDVGEFESAGLGGSRPAYRGTVRVDDSAEPLQVLDQVLAILRQGLPGASLRDVVVHQGATGFYDAAYVGLGDALLGERYGPQPGTGTPPEDQPPLKRYVPEAGQSDS
jgi:hypothetical protein